MVVVSGDDGARAGVSAPATKAPQQRMLARAPRQVVAVASPRAAAAAAPVEDKKRSQSASTATDVRCVEPSYKPKDAAAAEENKAAVIEPSARAIAAAGKFADKPEGNLLPTPSASMQPQAAQAAASSASQPAVNMAAEQKAQAQQAPAITGPKYTGEPISVHSKDVVPTIKKFLTQRGDVISDDRTNALIIEDIPSVMPGIDRLLTQLDRKTQEVEIEARVVAATRSFARDIGTQLGFGWGNGPSAVGGSSAAGTSPIKVGNTPAPQYIVIGGGTGGTQIPLFSNLPVTSPTSGLSFVNASNNVRIDAILTLAASTGLLKILSRPRVVTQNNIQALVRQGVRVPIVTQAQLGGPPTVTYVDAFLRLTVIPQITSEGTIFLNVDVENTTPDFGHTIQGNPTLITQQATTQVLVTDGGTVVIGGVIQTQNSVT